MQEKQTKPRGGKTWKDEVTVERAAAGANNRGRSLFRGNHVICFPNRVICYEFLHFWNMMVHLIGKQIILCFERG
jgi:hypothetical protein